MPKPDDRSDNVKRLQDSLKDTYEHVEEGEDFLKAHKGQMHPRQVHELEAKNDRRREAIEGYRNEIEDEAHRKD